jgi:glycosyltransferase involved in cell wall biosynthesis
MVRRKLGGGEELSYEANDWLMRTMAKECARKNVTAVHSYEDCSLWQFEAAKRMGKACIYDMPIGYYGWWQQKEKELAKKYRDWLPPEGISSIRFVRPEQKKSEMELADIVLAPSNFVAETIRQHFNKKVVVASYGTDGLLLGKNCSNDTEKPFRVLFVGTASVRKGVPMLLDTWRKLGWKDAELILVGSWQLGLPIGKYLPTGAIYLGKLPRAGLNKVYAEANWLVHPSNFEGFSLSILEALGVGVPVIASTATGAADLPRSEAVRLFEPENPEQLAEALIQTKKDRGKDLSQEARRIAEGCSWEKYREKVKEAVAPFV